MRTSYEDIHRLVIQMREGSTTARRDLIEAHVPLVFKAVQEFEDDEALSEALVTLVEEVDNFKHGNQHAAALPAYLKTAIGRAAAKHKRTRAHTTRHDAQRFIHSGRSLPEFTDFEHVDTLDEILTSCESVSEEKMVFYRSQGYNNLEVGLRIGLSPTAVQVAIQRLQLRHRVKERQRA